MQEDKVYIEKTLCPYCGENYTMEMLHKLWFSEGSYTSDCVGSKIYSSIKIYCTHCKKLVYEKEITEDIDYLDWEKNEL